MFRGEKWLLISKKLVIVCHARSSRSICARNSAFSLTRATDIDYLNRFEHSSTDSCCILRVLVWWIGRAHWRMSLVPSESMEITVTTKLILFRFVEIFWHVVDGCTARNINIVGMASRMNGSFRQSKDDRRTCRQAHLIFESYFEKASLSIVGSHSCTILHSLSQHSFFYNVSRRHHHSESVP